MNTTAATARVSINAYLTNEAGTAAALHADLVAALAALGVTVERSWASATHVQVITNGTDELRAIRAAVREAVAGHSLYSPAKVARLSAKAGA